jgi:curved DNA-binding protein CbpA
MRRLENLTFYEILEVKPTASQADILRAYAHAKKIYTLDSIGIYSILDVREIEEMSRLIEEAYQTVGNERKRMEYDRMLGHGQGRKTEALAPSFYDHVSQARGPLSVGETHSPDPKQREKMKEMISQAGFQYTGAALKEIRDILGFELAEISQRTKVSRTNLQLIEEEGYARLPAPAYLRGFVSEYAKCLGLDTTRVLEDYMSRYREWAKEVET